MQTLAGIAASPGVAIGEALVIDNEGFRIPRHFVMREHVDAEIQRLNTAFAAVGEEIGRSRDAIASQLGEQYGAIFSAHLQMLQDPKLHAEVEDLLRNKQCSPEYAVSLTLRRFAKVFEDSDSAYLAERAHDIYDIEKRLLQSLLGGRREDLAHLTSPVVVLAHNLTPSETANLNPEFTLGFVTEIGGAGGHTAIVARGLELPAVVGTGKFLSDVSGGDLVIVDGDQGLVIIDPDEATLARYRQEVEEHRSIVAELEALRDMSATTKDGVDIRLMANIEFPHEAAACLERGADGIGLYRTEFLFLSRESEPTEEDHFRSYMEVIQAIGDRPIVIRTLDLGADKMGLQPLEEEERNPFLGLRSIRLALRNLALFQPQLRAVLRASAFGQIKVMFPLISTLTELRHAKEELRKAMDELRRENIEFDEQIEIGMMVESPAAATMIDRFVKEVDFISIGTNDLIQYTLAVDRSNPSVADLYQATDPAVLRLIQRSLDAACEAGIKASLCGQMSSELIYTALLLGMGLRELSVPSSNIPEIKQLCRKLSIDQCEAIAAGALEQETAAAVENYLREESRKIGNE